MDVIGARGWCKKCKHGKLEQEDVVCKNKHSKFFGEKTNCILLAPCFEADKSKDDIAVKLVGFSD